MKLKFSPPLWSLVAPVLAWLIYFVKPGKLEFIFAFLLCSFLVFSIISAVHHAEVIAHRVGEPFGTMVLALAVTTIEVSLIVSLMLAGGESTSAIARDTVFAAVMIIITGMIGLCLLIGGTRYKEQLFEK